MKNAGNLATPFHQDLCPPHTWRTALTDRGYISGEVAIDASGMEAAYRAFPMTFIGLERVLAMQLVHSTMSPKTLKPEVPQSESVANNAHRRERHGGCCEDRGEQDAECGVEDSGRDRHPGCIVDERQA